MAFCLRMFFHGSNFNSQSKKYIYFSKIYFFNLQNKLKRMSICVQVTTIEEHEHCIYLTLQTTCPLNTSSNFHTLVNISPKLIK